MFQRLLVCHASAVALQEANIEAETAHRFLVSSGQTDLQAVDCRPEGPTSKWQHFARRVQNFSPSYLKIFKGKQTCCFVLASSPLFE